VVKLGSHSERHSWQWFMVMTSTPSSHWEFFEGSGQ